MRERYGVSRAVVRDDEVLDVGSSGQMWKLGRLWREVQTFIEFEK